MTRLATLAGLLTALSLAADADAGKRKHRPITIGLPGGPSITLPGGPGLKPPAIRPPVIKPPIIKPPVIRPPVIKPPIIKPRPPIVRPKPPIILPPRPPIVCPPRPPIITPPPIVVPKPPIVIPPAPPIAVCPPPIVGPPVITPPVCPPSHQVGYRFGLHLQRVQTNYGIGLQVVRVDYGSPAWRAGLQPNHVLLSANQQSLSQAVSNEHGVALLQAAAAAGQPVATTAPVVTLVSNGASPAPTVTLGVLNPRTNQMSTFYVTPEIVGGSAPAPTAAAPIALNPSQPTATL